MLLLLENRKLKFVNILLFKFVVVKSVKFLYFTYSFKGKVKLFFRSEYTLSVADQPPQLLTKF